MALTVPRWLALRLDPVDLLLRSIVALVLLDSGWSKIQDPNAFADTVRNYQILADPWIAWVAMALPAAQCLLAACLLLRVLYPGCVVVSGLLFTAFVAALASLLARGLDIDCGCLTFKVSIGVQILIDVLLIVICAALLWMWRRERSPRDNAEPDSSDAA